MLGSLSDADDAVQDAWLRLSRTDTSEAENLRAWLTTIVARVALNMLRARTTRREQPLDVHVPDPIIDPADGTDPEHEALLADSVGLALVVVLETLTPAERLAFVLRPRSVSRLARRHVESSTPPAPAISTPGTGYRVDWR
jgi:DNA-directed RNA polymerase specialized sigma24 family protein